MFNARQHSKNNYKNRIHLGWDFVKVICCQYSQFNFVSPHSFSLSFARVDCIRIVSRHLFLIKKKSNKNLVQSMYNSNIWVLLKAGKWFANQNNSFVVPTFCRNRISNKSIAFDRFLTRMRECFRFLSSINIAEIRLAWFSVARFWLLFLKKNRFDFVLIKNLLKLNHLSKLMSLCSFAPSKTELKLRKKNDNSIGFLLSVFFFICFVFLFLFQNVVTSKLSQHGILSWTDKPYQNVNMRPEKKSRACEHDVK